MELMAILEDSGSYPDTMKITIAGEEKTLGELRGSPAFKGFTKYSQERSREKQELEAKLQKEQAEREKLASDLQAAMAQRQQTQVTIPGQTSDPLAPFKADPTFAPLVDALEKSTKRGEDLEKQILQLQNAQWVNAHTTVINKIQERDPEFKDPAKVNELLKFAQNNGLSNLETAYALTTRERDIKKTEEAALKKGMEEGAKKARAEFSMVPSGTRRMITPQPDAPKSFDEAEDAALRDPEILATFNGSE